MKTSEKIIIAVVCVLAIVLAGIVIFTPSQTPSPVVGYGRNREGFGNATSTTVTCGATATTTLSGVNANRVYLAFSNGTSASTTLFFSATSTGASAGKGLILPANSMLSFDSIMIPVGQVWCISATGTVPIGVVEK